MNWNLFLLKLLTQKVKYHCGSHLQISIHGLTDFNCNCLNKLLENISKGQKSIFLLGDLNVNLLNYNEHNQTIYTIVNRNHYSTIGMTSSV